MSNYYQPATYDGYLETSIPFMSANTRCSVIATFSKKRSTMTEKKKKKKDKNRSMNRNVLVGLCRVCAVSLHLSDRVTKSSVASHVGRKHCLNLLELKHRIWFVCLIYSKSGKSYFGIFLLMRCGGNRLLLPV